MIILLVAAGTARVSAASDSYCPAYPAERRLEEQQRHALRADALRLTGVRSTTAFSATTPPRFNMIDDGIFGTLAAA